MRWKIWKEEQEERKDILRKTVAKIFDFGWFNETFMKESGQIDSFSALLYYIHILADYLADDPVDTELSVNGCDVPAYSGKASYKINGGIPKFTKKQKKETEVYKIFDNLDEFGRSGTGISCIGPDTLESGKYKNDSGARCENAGIALYKCTAWFAPALHAAIAVS